MATPPQGPSLPLIAPVHQVGVADLPTEIALGEQTVNGQRRVVMQIVHPMGVSFVFVSPEAAKAIGARLMELSTGIAIVPAGALPSRVH